MEYTFDGTTISFEIVDPDDPIAGWMCRPGRPAHQIFVNGMPNGYTIDPPTADTAADFFKFLQDCR